MMAGWRNKIGLVLMLAVYLGAGAWIFFRPKPGGEGKITIRIAHWQLESGVRQAIDAIIHRYEKLHPNVHVEQLLIPDTLYREWVQTQLTGGTAPDIMEYGWWYGRVDELAAKYFQPTTRWVLQPNPYNAGTPLAKVPWRDTFLDGLNSADGFNQQLNQYYAVSMTTVALRMFYNRALLRRITGSAEPPKNLHEFTLVCAQIKAYARAHHERIVPVAGARDNAYWMSDAMIGTIAVDLSFRLNAQRTLQITGMELALDYLRGEWSYQTPAILAGLKAARDFCLNMDPGVLQLSRDTAIQEFVRGDAVMIGTGTWDATSLKSLCAFPLGAFRVPQPDRDDPVYGRFVPGPYSDGAAPTSMGLYLTKASPHQAQAVDFLRFMTSMEGDQIFADVSNWLPSIVGVKPTKFSEQYAMSFAGYNPGASSGASYTMLAGPEADQLYKNNLYLLIGPTGSPKKFAAAMAAELRPKVITDITNVTTALVQNLGRQDVALAARHMLQATQPGSEPEHLLAVSAENLVEAQTYRYLHTLHEVTGGRP